MATLLGHLPLWIAVTVATWWVCWTLAGPQNCQDLQVCDKQMKAYPTYLHVVSSTALVAMSGHEVCGLIATYMGARQTQELIPHLQSRVLPSFLLALMFGWLAVVERYFSLPEVNLAHVHSSGDGLTTSGRPVYTLRYIEWCINVPILFLLSGHCSLGRPLREVSRPLLVTNVYIILSWMATVTEYGVLKWLLIIAAFHMYGWASMDMIAWSRAFEKTAPPDLPSRRVRPWLSNGLIIHFQLFGAIYMASAVGAITAEREQVGYYLVTFGAKIAYCATFVFIRADEYHKTLTDVLRKVSVSNVGMISILRGNFDIILPCVMDSAGRCKLPQSYSGDMLKLEKMLGNSVAGRNLADLLHEQSDKVEFTQYLRNVVRQADCPQAFSEATLTTSGLWSCGAGVMPPIAQVLHSKMTGASQVRLNATLHLSVVPRSAVSHGKERSLVAAIQLTEEAEKDEASKELDLGFESFKPTERQTSATSTTFTDAQSGIVANLADLNKLGASALLGSSEEGTEEGEGSWEGSQSCNFSHFGAFMHGFDELTSAFDARICGMWEGTTSEELGSYTQKVEFNHDCKHAKISVMEHTLDARFRMNCSVEPMQLDIQVIPSGPEESPPPIPYIFKFNPDGSLCLCGPSDSRLRRPTGFKGPGLCIMQRAQTQTRMPEPEPAQAPPLKKIHSSPPEPEPEFMRNFTEEAQEEQLRIKEAAGQWRDPALAASVALAITSTIIAVRKSI
mmetsp:Transcript_36520/g.85563  ORF Transcript_36520/g.85563 Transcript_36520/m.85563 type:complete len:732 (+) Transcript_36520:55-2250(+)